MGALLMDRKPSPDISIVIPVYNEAENIPDLYREISDTLNDAIISYEIIFVDDGSRDNSLEIIKALSIQDLRVRYTTFSRNFGHRQHST